MGLLARIKTWATNEKVTAADLNAEFDNILDNLSTTIVTGYSGTVGQMQTATNPGEVGTESLATTLAGEIERLRFTIREITGKDEWYESPASSIASLVSSIGGGLPANRLVSGRVRTNSSQGIFLVPDGAARTVTLEGATTNFIFYIDNTQYTVTTDVALTNLTLAPATNNTALVNDTSIADGTETKYVGEDGTEIAIDTIGSEITALVGKLAAFKVNNGSTDEYFIARVETNKLINAQRGYYFDSTDAPVPRIAIANNDTITLLKLSWIFVKTDLTLTATYTPPFVGADEPGSPGIGDYWFDTVNDTWKTYGGSTFAAANATLIGTCVQDDTNTIGARSAEVFKNLTSTNSVELFYQSATEVRARDYDTKISVYGTLTHFEKDFALWDMTADLDSGVSESSSTEYYFYITEGGDTIISDVKPFDRRNDLFGYYHPHQTWRYVGKALNDGSSNLSQVESEYRQHASTQLENTKTAAANILLTDRIMPLDGSGGAYTLTLPPLASVRGQSFVFVRTDNTPANAITIDGYASETIRGQADVKSHTKGEVWELLAGDGDWHVLRHYANTPWETYTPTIQGFGTLASDDFWWRRDGQELYISGEFEAGTPAASEIQFGFPSGATSLSTLPAVVAAGILTENQADAVFPTIIVSPNHTYFRFSYLSGSANNRTAVNGNVLFSAGVTISIQANCPIEGWEA